MRNLKVQRKIRAQSNATLRKKVRASATKVAELEAKCAHLRAQNHRLRMATPQRLPIPNAFPNVILERFSSYLARGMAEKVAREIPDLARGAHASARMMEEVFSGSARMAGMRPDDMVYEVKESFTGDAALFTLHLRDVRINHGEDLMSMKMMRDMPDPMRAVDSMVKAPTPIYVTEEDIQRAIISRY